MKKFLLVVSFILLFLSIVNLKTFAEPITQPPGDDGGTVIIVPPPESKDYSGILGKIRQAIDGISSAITNFFTESTNSYIANAVAFHKAQFATQIQGWKGLLASESMDSGKFIFAKRLNDIFKPTAYTLATLFLMMTIWKKSISFEISNYKHVIKEFLLFFVAKELIDRSVDILGMIIGTNTYLCNQVFSLGMGDLPDLISFNYTGIGSVFFKDLGLLICIMIMNLLFILCFIIYNLRVIELCFFIGTAPLFFSSFAGGVTSDVFKSFIKNFIATVAQTLWMAVGTYFFYNGLIGSTNGIGYSGLFDLLIGMGTLAIYIIKAPNSLKSILGTGGSSLNLGSLLFMLK